MDRDVKSGTRPYRSDRRTAKAAATRTAVLDAARALLLDQGYAATTVAQVAARAGVAVDTVYASVGTKPTLLRALVESALSGTDEAVPAEQRAYVQQIRATAAARDKLAVYAAAVAQIGGRMAPVHRALRDAAAADAECAALQAEISARRAAGMRLFAQELRTTGELREDLDDGEVADVVWSLASAEVWALLVGERAWSAERYRAWLLDTWTRTLLA